MSAEYSHDVQSICSDSEPWTEITPDTSLSQLSEHKYIKLADDLPIQKTETTPDKSPTTVAPNEITPTPNVFQTRKSSPVVFYNRLNAHPCESGIQNQLANDKQFFNIAKIALSKLDEADQLLDKAHKMLLNHVEKMLVDESRSRVEWKIQRYFYIHGAAEIQRNEMEKLNERKYNIDWLKKRFGNECSTEFTWPEYKKLCAKYIETVSYVATLANSFTAKLCKLYDAKTRQADRQEIFLNLQLRIKSIVSFCIYPSDSSELEFTKYTQRCHVFIISALAKWSCDHTTNGNFLDAVYNINFG